MKKIMSVILMLLLVVQTVPFLGFAEEPESEHITAETENDTDATIEAGIGLENDQELQTTEIESIITDEDLFFVDDGQTENLLRLTETPANNMMEQTILNGQMEIYKETTLEGSTSTEENDDKESSETLLMETPVRVADVSDFRYTIIDGNVQITGYNGTETELVIPDEINGFPVTSIGDWAFQYNNWLLTITIPESVTSIGAGAFYECSSLTMVTIGNSVTSIGDSAFSGCTGLTSITIPESVTSIGNDVFSGCTSLGVIYYNAEDSQSNESVFIEAGLFSGTGLNVVFGDSVKRIPDGLFKFCHSLTTVTIGSNVTSIGKSAFSNCDSLTSITIPDSVSSIGRSAFATCTGLTSITIPENVTEIGRYAFANCSGLTTVYYNAIEVPELSGSDDIMAFAEAGSSSVTGLSVVFGDSVKRIPAYLFHNCGSLTMVTIGAAVTEIGADAFYNCNSLPSITIPENVTRIGDFAFYGCGNLTTVTILNRTTLILYNSFRNVSSSIEICGIDCSTAAQYARIHGYAFRAIGTAEHVMDPNDPGTTVLEATCEVDGRHERTCTICGAAVETVLPAVGHRWGDPAWRWSADLNAASAVFTCLNDATHLTEVEADVTVEIVDATPTATGLKTGTATVVFDGKTFTSRAEQILTVLDTTYTLRYDANGGNGAPIAQTLTNNTLSATFTVSSIVPVRRGYAFKGWARIEDAEQPTEGTYVTLNYPETELVLYAVWEANVPTFKSQSLVLSGQIGLNFFLELPEVESVDYSCSYMTFTIGQDKTEYRDDFDPDHMNGAHTRYGFTCYVNSIQMADTITATFHYGDGKTVSKEYSVLKYIEFFEDNISAFNAKTIALIRAIADFGHYEQIYLAYVNHWTIGDKYAEMATHYTDTFNYASILSSVNDKAFVKSLGSSNVEKATYKLHLDSETTVDVFLTPMSGKTLTASAAFNGKTYKAVKQSDGRYLVQIPNIAAHQLGDMITVEGNAGGAFTVKVSALSYVRSVLANNMTDAEKDGMAALYQYYTAVLAYRK